MYQKMFDYNFHWRPVLKSLPDLIQAVSSPLTIASIGDVSLGRSL